MASSKLLDQFRNMHMILDVEETGRHKLGALYLGDYNAANDLRMLRERNIRTVLTCAGNLEIFYSNQIVHHIYEDMVDIESCDLLQHFDKCILAI
jgi:hypothetical protein